MFTNRSDLQYPEWQTPLQDVILEFDLKELLRKIQRVETLIFERLQQLRLSQDGAQERVAINEALDVLRTIKRERLQFPDWK
jgi:cell division FtsZ-interacting protein ZapD